MAEVQAGQESAQEQPDPAAATPGAEGEGAAPPRTYSQADLDRITAKVRKNAARDAELRYRREQDARQPADKAAPDKPADAKPAEEAAPKREDFATYEDYSDARTDYRARKATREENAKIADEARQRSQSEAAQARASTFRKRADEYMKTNPDFAEDMESATEVQITREMADEVEESEFGPAIMHHLVKNPQEAERISKLPPSAQRREMYKLESKFEAAAKKPGKAESDETEGSDKGTEGEDRTGQPGTDAEGKGEDAERNTDGTFKSQKRRPAPDPIEPGSGRSSASSTQLPSDKDSMKEWVRKADLQAKKEGRR